MNTLNHKTELAKGLKGLVFVYKPSGCGFEFRCSHQLIL